MFNIDLSGINCKKPETMSNKRCFEYALALLGGLSPVKSVTTINPDIKIKEDPALALRLLLVSAYRGHAESQFMLWLIYNNTSHAKLKINVATAYKWLVAAFIQGFCDAVMLVKRLDLEEVSRSWYYSRDERSQKTGTDILHKNRLRFLTPAKQAKIKAVA